MLSENALDNLMQPIIDRQEAINNYVVKIIAQRVKEIGHLLPSDVYKLERLLKTGVDVRKINKEIARLTGLNEKAIKELIKQVALDSYLDTRPYFDYRQKPFIPFVENKALQNVVKAVSTATLDTYKNLSNAQAFMIRDLKNPEKLKPTSIAKTYQSVLDEAIQASQSGTIDYNTAMRRTMKQLADSGIRSVTYHPESGRTYTQRLDTAVRRNLMDGIRAINQGVQDEVGKQYGADGKEITVHAMSAPDHEPVQGLQFTNEEYDKLQNEEAFEDYTGQKFAPIARHIGCLNCKHFTYSIILGVNKPNFNKAQLEKLKKENQKGYIDKKGRHHTKYECTQKMREMETEIRRHKERYLALQESGDTEGAKAERATVSKLHKEYKAFCEACGLKPQMNRARVAGYK